MKRVLLIFLLICVFILSACTSTSQIDQEDLSTPESVISLFIGAAADKDSGKMQSLFAIDEIVDGFDAQKRADYLHLPVDQAAPISTTERIGEITDEILRFNTGL